MSSSIVQAAIDLANDKIMMDSYKDFYNGLGYFLTKNKSLGEDGKKPKNFPSKNNFETAWRNILTHAQRKYLLLKSGVDERSISTSKYETILKAYEKWNRDYIVVVYGGDKKDKGWACNLFVGEALYWAKKNTVIDGKYLSAKQIWNGEGKLSTVAKKDVVAGHIAAFGGTHVEIVTKVTRNQSFFDDEFCSRGAGRGSSDFGTERCESNFLTPNGGREINDDNIRFFRVN
jgi:hypothetical protein